MTARNLKQYRTAKWGAGEQLSVMLIDVASGEQTKLKACAMLPSGWWLAAGQVAMAMKSGSLHVQLGQEHEHEQSGDL